MHVHNIVVLFVQDTVGLSSVLSSTVWGDLEVNYGVHVHNVLALFIQDSVGLSFVHNLVGLSNGNPVGKWKMLDFSNPDFIKDLQYTYLTLTYGLALVR